MIQVAGFSVLTVVLSAGVALGCDAWGDAMARREAELPSDFAIQAIALSPKSGSTLMAGEPIQVTFNYRFSRPQSLERVLVIATGPNMKKNGVATSAEREPGEGTFTSEISTTDAEKIDTLLVIVNNKRSIAVLHKEIAVDYTVVANPAAAAIPKPLAAQTPTSGRLSGAQIVERWTGTPSDGSDRPASQILAREYVDGYLAGVADATQGTAWCNTRSIKPHELDAEVIGVLKDLPATQTDDTAAAKLAIAALAKHFPCNRGKK